VSLVAALSLVLGVIAGGAVFVLFRRRAWLSLAVGFIVSAGAAVWILMPVCVVIAPEDLAGFRPPIETRTDTGLIGQRIFKKRGDNWYQCKTRIARAFFF